MSKFIPNSFQVPNAFVDEYLDYLSGKAVKCYLLIARKTTGWQKEFDRISTSQFMEKCGIKDRKTAFAAIEELEAVKLILVERKQGEINAFSLNFFIDENNDLAPVPKNGTSTKNSHQPVPKNGTSTSTKNWHSTKDNNKNNITNTTLSGCNARAREKTPKKSTALELLAEFGIVDQLAEDFIAQRKAKKAVISRTMLERLQVQADLAKLPLAEVVAIMIDRNWQGFKADWDWRGEPKNTAKNSSSTKPNTHGGFAERDYSRSESLPDWAQNAIEENGDV